MDGVLSHETVRIFERRVNINSAGFKVNPSRSYTDKMWGVIFMRWRRPNDGFGAEYQNDIFDPSLIET